MARLTLTPRASRAAQRGRPWFFADDVVSAAGKDETVGLRDGDFVEVCTDRGVELGVGLFAASARIRLRLVGGDGGMPPRDFAAFLRDRLRSAIARRRALLATPRPGVRLVHAEADGIPGLIVDRYDDCLAIQLSAAALEPHRQTIVTALVEQLAPRAIVARHDIAIRSLEGLPRGVEVLHGEPRESVTIEEHGVRHEVRLLDGHKTGFYLDQRPARARVQALAAAGRARRVLDVFSYQGGFALAALAGGAESALAIDQSADALARATAAARDNGLAGLEVREANAFDLLRELRETDVRFDLIVLDPPPFAKSRRELRGGSRGYRDLNRLAMRLLAPSGHLLTCSCSHHVTPPMFEDLLRQAAAGVRDRIMLRDRLMAGEDHPAWISLPESEYLKSYLLERVDLDA